MILLQTVPYLRRRAAFTAADEFGAWVVHQDSARAALKYGSVDGLHLYIPPSPQYSKTAVLAALDELRQEFPGREIEIQRTGDLHALAKRHQYVLADDFESFAMLAVSRGSGQRECAFPLCTIVHTIPRHSGMIGYSNVLLLAEPGDVIVATSESGARSVRTIFDDVGAFIGERWEATVRKPQIVQIPLGVDTEFLSPRDRSEARAELGLPADSTILLYLGRLSETFKADLEPLLDVYRRLSAGNSRLHLVIAGQDKSGSYSKVLDSLAREAGIRDEVSLITNFPYEQKPLLYAACDIFVSPVDNVQETFGLSVLEAMASGVPVVASDWSGYRDLVVHGETGFLVRTVWNPEAASLADLVSPFHGRTEHALAQQTVVDNDLCYSYLKLLVDNEELRRELGRHGRDRVMARFSWPVVMRQYEALWKEQWEQWGRRDKTARYPAWNTNRHFGHFATTDLEKDMTLRFSPWRLGEGNPQLTDPEVRRVVAECQSGPQSVGDLLASGSQTTATSIVWLWKKGYLQVVV